MVVARAARRDWHGPPAARRPSVDNARVQGKRSAAGVVQDTANARRAALAGLTLAVTVAHLALLQTLPGALEAADPARTRAFTTRSIVLQPPPPPPPAAPQARPSPPAPPPRPRRPPAPPKPAAAQAAAPARVLATPVPTEAPAAAPAEIAAAPDSAAPVPGDAIAEAPTEALPAADTAASAAVDAAVPPPLPAPSVASADAEPLALAIPGSVRLKYTLTGEAKKQTYHAMGELLWLQDGQTYDARMEFSAFFVGSRVRTSSGTITTRGLEPRRFSDKWRRELAAHFERDKARVSFSANTPAAPLPPDAQDQLSVLLQLTALAAGDPAKFSAGAVITLPVVGPRDLDHWSFTLLGPETLSLPAGQTETLKLQRNPRKPFDQKVEAWLAPSLAYMPVRVRITQPNGDFMDQQLRSVDEP